MAKYNQVKDVATQLWQQYSDASNRLDYMDSNSTEYHSLDTDCTALKSKYDEAKRASDTAYQTMMNKRQEVAQLYCWS